MLIISVALTCHARVPIESFRYYPAGCHPEAFIALTMLRGSSLSLGM